MESGKVLLGVLAGVATGAILGILFAPSKGSETREKISKKSHDYAEGLEDRLNEFMEDVTGKFEEMMAEAKKVKQSGQTRAEELLNDAAKAVHPKD